MSFIDDLTGRTQGRAYENAQRVAGANFARNTGTLGDAYSRARDETKTGFANAIAGLDNAAGDIRSAGTTALTNINAGRDEAGNLLGQGRAALRQAGDRFAGLEDISGSFSPARETMLDALGLRGAEGLGRARETFGNTLQSNFEMDQGLEAINRARAARGAGTVGGGNIDRDAQLFGQQLANSRTNQYLDRLLGLTDREIDTSGTAAAGRSAADTNIANLFSTEAGIASNAATNRANIAQSTSDRLANIARSTAGLETARGTSLADLELGEGQGTMNLQNQMDQSVINSILGGAQAQSQGAGNIANLGTNLITGLATSASGFWPNE